MQYDFNLVANGGMTLDVAGKFFKYKSGTGAIRIRTSGGGYVDLLPGQGVWNVDFSMLQILDTSGGANKGVILAGNFDFHDDRIAGTVDVVDGGKAKTLSNIAFMTGSGLAAAAGQYAHLQLWNPIASGKNLIVESISFSSYTANAIYLGQNALQMGTLIGAGVSKKTGSGASFAEARNSVPVANVAGAQYLACYILGNTPFIWAPKEPLIVAPGFGIYMGSGSPNASIFGAFEWYEDPI